MFVYYNANPFGRHVNDCSVRAISLAQEKSWDQTYKELAEFARKEGITFSEIEFIDKHLDELYPHYCFNRHKSLYLIKDFLEEAPKGRWLLTMAGHITCVIDGVCYDTFDPSYKILWCAYKVKG